MKYFLLASLITIINSLCFGQLRCVPIDFTLTQPIGTHKLILNPGAAKKSISIEMPRYSINLLPEHGFAIIDSQLTQFTLLKLEGLTLPAVGLKENEQKILLQEYSKYEIDYLKQELNIEIINPNNQWVTINQRPWLIWYFKVGQVPVSTNKKFSIQLYATTLEGSSLLTINMPIEQNGDFGKSAYIMNAMMEGMRVAQ